MIRHSFTRAATAGVLLLAVLPSVHAQSKGFMGGGSYADMCRESVNMPAPMGETDLKGNPKLDAYCECFGAKFMVRAQKAAAYMQANPGKPPKNTLEQNMAEELAMRNSCRKQLGLPAAVDPNAAPAAAGTTPPGPKRK